MKHLALAAAGWWPTWVLFALTAWGGLALATLWVMHWLFRWQDRGAVPYTITPEGDDALGYDTARAMLDGRGTLTETEWDTLLKIEKEFQ